MRLVCDATKQELERALDALRLPTPDPYKKFKDALAAGKRVRCSPGGIWSTGVFNWMWEPSAYEIEPEYFGHTEEQWQFVIDGGFLVSRQYSSGWHKLTQNELANMIRKSNYKVSIVRQKGIKQPVFGRNVDVITSVLIHSKRGYGMYNYTNSQYVTWDDVDWFIEL